MSKVKAAAKSGAASPFPEPNQVTPPRPPSNPPNQANGAANGAVNGLQAVMFQAATQQHLRTQNEMQMRLTEAGAIIAALAPHAPPELLVQLGLAPPVSPQGVQPLAQGAKQ